MRILHGRLSGSALKWLTSQTSRPCAAIELASPNASAPLVGAEVATSAIEPGHGRSAAAGYYPRRDVLNLWITAEGGHGHVL